MAHGQDEEALHHEVRRRLLTAGCSHFDANALELRDLWGVIAFSTAERYWECFDVLAPLMTDAEYATTLRETWVARNGLPPADARRRLLEHGRPITQRMWMTDDDAQTFDALPDVVTIHRGCIEGFEHGRSWSLSIEAAQHFASSQADDEQRRVVVTGTIPKRDIIALFSGNWDEEEVVTPGERVMVTRLDTVD